MSTTPPALAKAFQTQDYEGAMKIAQYMYHPIKAKVICTIHVKNQDVDSLNSYLELEEVAAHRQDLLFFYAYADYCAKRDASWFLKVEGSHPKYNALKQQILYRKQQYDYAQACVTIKAWDSTIFEQVINNLAIAARCGYNYTPPVRFESFEFWYNYCLYSAQQCKFEEAIEYLAKAQMEAEKDPEAISKRDLEQFRVMDIILAKYSRNENKPYMLDDFETPACRSLLEVFKLLTNVNFVGGNRFVESIRMLLGYLHNDLNIVKYRCDASVLPYLETAFAIVSSLIGSKNHAKRCNNCNYMMRRSAELATLAYLPSMQLQRKVKKASESDIYNELVTEALQYPFKQLKYTYNEYQRDYFARFYKAFGMLPACAQLGVLPINCLLYVQDYRTTEAAGLTLLASLGEPGEIRAELLKANTQRKPMPYKWYKKKKRGANAGKHQGADVKGREEISKIKLPPAYSRGKKGGRRKGY